jgi:acyl carrier protein
LRDVSDQVRQIIIDHFASVKHVDVRHADLSLVVPHARLIEDLSADSLDLMEIVFALEDEFGREITEGDLAKVETVGHLIELIERQQ